MSDAKQDVVKMLGEETERKYVWEQLKKAAGADTATEDAKTTRAGTMTSDGVHFILCSR